MNAPIFKRHAAPFPPFQVTDDGKHNESTTTLPAYSCRRIQQRRRRFPRSAEPTGNSPARNRPEAQDPWRNRRPFPAKLPRIRRGAAAGEAAAADEHVAKQMPTPNAPQTIARKRSWKTPVEPRTRPYKSNPHPPPPTCQKVTHNYQRSPWRAAISRFSIVKCRQQISHGNTAPCVAKPPPAIREVTP